ncbi:MAG TPA: signal peptidase I [Clostridiaceae bacterium]
MKKIFTEIITPILAAIVISILVNKFVFFKIKVPTLSMYPTIKAGDQIIVTRIYNLDNLKRGDLIVFYSKELKDSLIKRLVGLPGDKVEVTETGEVIINGVIHKEPYVVNSEAYMKSFQVPLKHYLFFGDNRSNSNDSRKWKDPYIEGTDIKGKAQFIIYPFSRFGSFVTGSLALKH